MRADIARQIRLASLLHAVSRGAPGRALLLAALRLEPRLLGALAAWTRIPAARLAAA
jgi:hypothetical protein